MSRTRVAVVGPIAFSVMLAACQAATPSVSAPSGSTPIGSAPPGESAPVATPPGDAKSRTLVIASTGTPTGFDGDVFGPNLQQVIVQLNEPLVGNAPPAPGGVEVDGSNVVPKLAESWTESPDGKTWKFKLREGVKSCLGNELTADDVVFAFEKSVAQKRTGLFLNNVTNIQKVSAASKYEVQFDLSAPSSFFLPVRAVYAPAIVDSTEAKKHATAEDPYATEWLKTSWSGFGAYCLESNEADQQAVFVANPNYYAGEPYFNRVIYRAVPDASNRATLLQSGQVDLMEEPTFAQLAQLKSDPRVKVVSVVGNQIATIQINPNFEPFTDVRVRQAIAYAIDGDRLVRDVYQGLGTVSKSPVPPATPGSTSEFWTFDLNYDKAKELLTQAGYPNGLDIELTYAQNQAWEESLAVSVQESLANAGIRVTLNKLANDVIFARTGPAATPRDVPFFTWMDQAVVPDAAYAMYNNSALVGPARRNDWTHPDFESYIQDAIVTQDPDKRAEDIAQAQKIHVQDVSWAAGVLIGSHAVMSPSITGYVWYPDNRPRWVLLSRQGG
jgi:peptide/nickel transport system substrate-binding protein